ncbi:MAG: response regulator transcription factor [Acidobacteria bacterium]|jgi:two-component system response regulator CpxR|nr:response regulator transcription factor [Acidobacteriota bacterium]
MSILIIDDDVELCELVTDYLEDEGFDATSVYDGVKGVERCLTDEPELVILDVMLPGLGGFAVLSKIREVSKVPVIMLTARGEDVDRIVGLEMGADDYLSKPFNPRELVARIRAILRRTSETFAGDGDSAVLTVDDLEMDLGSRQIRTAAGEIDLTGAEFGVLETLVRAAGTVVARDDLSRQALGRRASAYDRSLDVHLSNLRRKLGPLPDGGERIKTVRGVGYLYVKPSGSAS